MTANGTIQVRVRCGYHLHQSHKGSILDNTTSCQSNSLARRASCGNVVDTENLCHNAGLEQARDCILGMIKAKRATDIKEPMKDYDSRLIVEQVHVSPCFDGSVCSQSTSSYNPSCSAHTQLKSDRELPQEGNDEIDFNH
ncbi:hypothetical protein BLNAU_4322 [Blattamonas nauphoetae]|uniref:Uncharacterized protein n=1 Tax=Blattamonas nauphoetae TaxID=2049346 RepID=A0ABQ9YAB8_9EUKA|nr:hypothetical protein BLNAU_4322 [Blattamonas nauphoetae]